MNKKCREANFDLLRLICTIAVIVIHVSGTYKGGITDSGVFGHLVENNIIVILLYNTLSRFAVPCFVMLSGAFLLSDNKNGEYIYFYNKSIKTIVFPTLIFTILYFLYSEAIECIKIVIRGNPITGILSPVKNLIAGAPYYHMWYMYMLIGLYFFIPLIIQVKSSLGEKNFLKISVVLMIITSISGWTSTFELNWSIAKVICYIGYLMMGYQFRKYNLNKKNNVKAMFLVMVGIVILLGLTYIQYQHSLMGIAEADEKYSIVENFNPLVVVASLSIFAGFSKLNINFNLSKIVLHTFNIYLIHAVIWTLVGWMIRKIFGEGDARFVIPICVCVVFLFSFIFSIIYSKIWDFVKRRYKGK